MEDEELIQSQVYKPTPYVTPQQLYGSVISSLTNPHQEIAKLELTYRGFMLDEEGNPRQVGEPLMNDRGINSVVGITRSIVNQVCIMGNLDQPEIRSLIMFFADTLSKDLMMNRVYYDIKNSSARDKIFDSAITLAYITMKRPFNEGDRRFFGKITQENRMTVENNTKQKGFLSGLWNKKSG